MSGLTGFRYLDYIFLSAGLFPHPDPGFTVHGDLLRAYTVISCPDRCATEVGHCDLSRLNQGHEDSHKAESEESGSKHRATMI